MVRCIKCLALLFGLMLFVSCSTNKQPSAVADNEPTPVAETRQEEAVDHSPSTLIVMYDAEVGKGPLLKAVEESGCEIIYDYKNFNGMALKKPDGKTLEETMELLRKVKGVLTVNYDRRYQLD